MIVQQNRLAFTKEQVSCIVKIVIPHHYFHFISFDSYHFIYRINLKHHENCPIPQIDDLTFPYLLQIDRMTIQNLTQMLLLI